MAFTNAEVKKCSLLSANQVFKNGSFVKWVFLIMDGYGESYEWVELNEKLNYASTPTDIEVSNYVKDYLEGNSHASGGGTYSSLAPTQATVEIKTDVKKQRNGILNNAPGKTPNPPGNPT
tara:strand:+ start:5082 stop:5441 length:360 start_codon:yes stop_codon:yes gene_type:complete